MWNPDEQECRSYWGYGNGYYMEEDHARAKEHGYVKTKQTVLFCNRCPISQECWKALHDRVRVEHPEEAAKWDAIVERNKAAGIDSGRIAAALMRAGRPDPWMKDMLANMRTGQESRSAVD